MILSDQTIAEFIDGGMIGIEPDITAEQIQPASLDLRLGDTYYNSVTDTEHVADDTVTLEPGVPYLGHTMDTVSLPDHIAAVVAGRSTVGRKHVVIHQTAGFIDPGFSGSITLEIFNHNNKPVEFDVGDRVCQLFFFPLDRPSKGYDGQYQGQEGVTHANNV